MNEYSLTERKSSLPPFPEIKENVKFKIALFHGSFVCAKLYNGDEIKEEYKPYPLEWVKDFDYVLLGDIHKRQLFNYKKKYYLWIFWKFNTTKLWRRYYRTRLFIMGFV